MILALLRRLFPIDTPAEAEAADRGAADAYQDVFDPPVRPEMAAAYKRGWQHVAMQW